ncbi:sensor histidine kinase [Sphingomonas sp. AAP5]|uniref:sensor histidine kinase n=1 Tax=Sphingomonas sp. AAP5 TaxID=1523415 RepID=UPI0010575C5D|nr:ATP-binding protein [Sphingomonas sp. AAP5]QBM76814.1 sensor histidine kinase [Sphingomonas sp. AAP5]
MTARTALAAVGRSIGVRWGIVAAILAIAAAWGAGRLAEQRVVTALHQQVESDARLRAALLNGELARFRLLPLTLADDRDVIAAIGGSAAAKRALDIKLEALSRVTGAPAIYVIGSDGITISASNWRSAQSFVGADYRFRPYFRDALARGEASQYALGTVSGHPGLYLSRRIANRGVIVIKLEFDRIERVWASAGGITLVRNPLGVVLVTSRPAWRFAATRPLSARDEAQFRGEARVTPAALAPLPVAAVDGEDRFVGLGTTFLARAVVTAQPGWQLLLLQPIDAAVAAARRAASVSAALATIALAALAWAWRQRVTQSRRRTEDLERAVARQTADLRREMDERAESEARAAELREALRQANRLAALGQITASVAHETAQPVAAIRTYAASGAILLDRGAMAEARENFVRIGGLAERIGAVTAQLRGFARRQTGEVRPVDIAEVIDGALLILRQQLRGVTLDLPTVAPHLAVIGGKVRLEQVLVIVMQNAVEAIAACETRQIALTLTSDATHVRLVVADTGPGVSTEIAERLFTPFVTSRPQGLGLGLVIAHDIMVELGGTLRLLPGEGEGGGGGGARFEIGMRRA